MDAFAGGAIIDISAHVTWRVVCLIVGVPILSSCGRTVDERGVPTVAADLEILRAATAPLRVLDSAVAAGYARVVKDCLIHEHHGAMGFHHVNAPYVDKRLDLKRPEILLYEQTLDRQYRLNGVEFIVPYTAWPRDSAAPELMGRRLLREDNLKIWYLHVWAWKQNPDGLFANFHPDVQCPPAVSKVFRPSTN